MMPRMGIYSEKTPGGKSCWPEEVHTAFYVLAFWSHTNNEGWSGGARTNHRSVGQHGPADMHNAPHPRKHHSRKVTSLGHGCTKREAARESKNISTLYRYDLTRVIPTIPGGILQTGKLGY